MPRASSSSPSSLCASGAPKKGVRASRSLPAYDEAGPRASAMIGSLRAFGYDLPTALADLIDNSITAGAKHIRIDFHWDGANSAISIRDDGCGMSETELVVAMRPGSRSPLEPRSAHDLGRFGLGLKTASFSQCRWMTVNTKCKGGASSTRCWNLDYVCECDEWRLLHDAPAKASNFLSALNSSASGTLVLWQKLDRLVSSAPASNAAAQNHFYAAIDEVKQHLAMTFHDYLFGPGALQILINGHRLAAWDAFLTDHDATQCIAEQILEWNGSQISLSSYVLPHHTRLNPKEWEAAGGPRGWNAQQGFYIYRNRRLLVAGDWLGLPFGKEEHYKLARIRVDLPNDADADWHLDVKKSSARLPADLRDQFKRTAILTRKAASDVYRHRGKTVSRKPGAANLHLWEQKTRRGKLFYSLNFDHPLVKSVLNSSNEPGAVKALLRLVQETVPAASIALDASEKPQEQAAPFERVASHRVQSVMKQVYRALCEGGRSPAEARSDLAQMDAFARFPELVAVLDEAAEGEDVLDNNDEEGERDL